MIGDTEKTEETFEMEIQLFDNEEPLAFKRILIYPYPDLRRLWVRIWLPPQMEGDPPNVELTVINPDGSENNSLVLLAQTDTKLDHTLHLKDPVAPGSRYRVRAELTVGFGSAPERVDQREFDLVLEFRNPEAGEMGFGIGFDQPESGAV